MNGPSIARAIPTTAETLRKALAHALTQIVRLRAEIRERDEMIQELQAMLSRST